ncbi:hypothetical protein ZWY2020_012363 [Hordeum vulgare]|nr:hypothetical protein ZWY2020_012363 [Hordeum vulgare]
MDGGGLWVGVGWGGRGRSCCGGLVFGIVEAALSEAVCHNLASVFADGFLHWLIHPMFRFAMRPAAAVLYFSAADETLSLVRPPPFDWEEGAHLTELDDRLCIVREDLPCVSVLIWLEIWKPGGR